MIDELHVQDVALIREAQLQPSRHLTVITGETGAGKTALLAACKLICGERADATLVREGAEGLLVQGRFYSDQVVHDALDEPLDFSEGVVAQRWVSADGRSRVSLAGRMAQVGNLASTVGRTIDLCGQHEHQRLMKAAHHRTLLDAWAQDSIAHELSQYRESFEAAVQAAEEVERIQHAGQADAATVEQARFTLQRIDEVAPTVEEYDELQAQVPRIEHAQALKSALEGAHAALADDQGALDALNAAAQALESAAAYDSVLGEYAQTLRESSYVIEDVARDVRLRSDETNYDAQSLEQLQDRLGQLQGLMHSWGPTMEQVFEAREQASRVVEATEGFAENLARAQAAQAEAEAHLQSKAEALHQARVQAAPSFEEAVTAIMARLQLEGAALSCAVDMQPRESWTADGPDAVQFLFQPGAGLSARPLVKIASGGEISRVMLAIKVALGSLDDVDTLVFDEVDAGVGGTAARALADVLADLSTTHQVLVVTHLPQIAVMADTHYVAAKSEGAHPETTLTKVEDDDRVYELARMLSGDTEEASIEHARQMLASAHATSQENAEALPAH